MRDVALEIRDLTNISFRAHVRYLMGKIYGEKRSYGFITVAAMIINLDCEPDSEEFQDTFMSFTSLGFDGARWKGANEAKDLYVDIYKRIKSHMTGRSDRNWIQRVFTLPLPYRFQLPNRLIHLDSLK